MGTDSLHCANRFLPAANDWPVDHALQARRFFNTLSNRSMRPFAAVFVFSLFCLHGSSTFAADAAVEAQEGDVEHWIEYYEKERARNNAPVKSQEAASGITERNDASPDAVPQPKPATQERLDEE
jgi:hypothetical protein